MIYLDHNSTTPCDARVVKSMLPFLSENFGNPDSGHMLGETAAEAIEEARFQVISLIGGYEGDIIFTSGATEANNLVIRGVLEGTPNAHFVFQPTEHKSVIEPFLWSKRNGAALSILKVDDGGEICLDELEEVINKNTKLISIMAANNEIGKIFDIEKVGEICRHHGVLFHCDATQAVGQIKIDVAKCGIDFLSISAHKFYGPKGIGCLYVSNRGKKAIYPQIIGGGQELGVRSGTLATHQVVGMGAASEIVNNDGLKHAEHMLKVRNQLWNQIKSRIPDVSLNGKIDARLPNNLNIHILGVEAKHLAKQLSKKNIACSTGSACSNDDLRPSHVLRAIGLSDLQAASSLRLGVGRYTSYEDVDHTSKLLEKEVSKIRGMMA